MEAPKARASILTIMLVGLLLMAVALLTAAAHKGG